MELRIELHKQLRAFYSIVFSGKYEMRPTHVSLYIFLLNQNNRNMWVEWFKCPYDLAMEGALINSKTTYYSVLDDLVSFELIEYRKGVNLNKSPKIRIVPLIISKNDTLTVPICEPLPDTITDRLSIPLTEPLPEHIYKLLTNNIKLITNNLEFVLKCLEERGQFIKNDNQEKEKIFYDKYMHNTPFWESTAKIIDIQELAYKKRLDEFLHQIIASGDINKPPYEYKRWFHNWLTSKMGYKWKDSTQIRQPKT